MKVFETRRIKELDAYTIKHEPIKSIDLMERASESIAHWIIERYDANTPFLVFAGPGNNGGDAMALARILLSRGFTNVQLALLKNGLKYSDDCNQNRKRLIEEAMLSIKEISVTGDFPKINSNQIIIDGLFGSGLNRPLEGLAAELVRHINASGAQVISIDIPSGLMGEGEDNENNNTDHTIRATHCLSFEFPKLAFLFAENEKYIGVWHLLKIGINKECINETDTQYFFTQEKDILPIIHKRDQFSHKGTYGHALLVAGSIEKIGAAILSSRSCMRSGVGLLTTHIPFTCHSLLMESTPELMTSLDASDIEFTVTPDTSRYDAIGVGPGIGTSKNTQKALSELISCKKPMIIDADAINILAENKEWLKKIPPQCILTPHPKEFERLAGKTKNGFERMQLSRSMASEYNIIIVLKGAYTLIACPDGSCHFNSTGNSGMATAGSGDVLTGIILSLLSQAYEPKHAAILGVYLHGLAGDFAAQKIGQDSMIASDITDHLGEAFKHIRLIK